MYESTLSPEARQRLRQIGQADIVIGIPSHRNGRTIGEVVRAISEGIATYLYDQRVVLMIADGGSSDNTVRHIADAAVTPNVEKLINIYEGATGKGTAIRSIFEVTAELQAKAGLVIEARAPGIMPEWLPALLTPILSGDDLAMACYQRSAYASALGDNLMYPFLHTFFGANLRDPLAAEFSLSGAMAADLAGRDVWETDVARFGINIWIAIQSLAENRRMSQVSVGYRGDGSGEPGMPLDARFLHSVGTMFRLLAVHRRLWQHEPAFRQIPMRAAGGDDEHIPCPDCYAELLVAFKEGGERYTNEWRRTLSPATLREIVDAMNGPMEQFDYSPQLWARTVAEFAVIYNQGEGDPDKVAEALLPLFYGRTATYLQRTRNMTPLQREAEITGIVRAFDESKSHLVEKWQSYELWADDGLF
jgi:hypothetical protein